MRFSLDWIRDFVEVTLTPAQLAARLTGAGIEVAGWEEIPAAAGAHSPAPAPTTTGTERRLSASSRPDVVFEIDITANRPDAMNHFGLAREIAALLDRPLTPPSFALPEDREPAAEAASVRVEADDLCPRYAGRVVKDLRLAESPSWMRDRLLRIGLTPKNNIVDAANYVLFELGQPLHTFDLDTLAGRGVVARRAHKGEKMVTVVDREERALDDSMLVIADAGEPGRPGRPAAIAGVMGGYESAIADSTRNVLIESAWFDPGSVRRTARALGMHTDASHRFERGADPGMTVFAANRLAALLAELGGGRVLAGLLDAGPWAKTPSGGKATAAGAERNDARMQAGPESGSADASGRLETQWRAAPVILDTARVGEFLGVELAPGDAARTLARLSIVAAPSVALDPRKGAENTLQAYRIPSWRGDLTRDVDLIEEYARMRGYEGIPETLPRIEPPAQSASLSEREDKARVVLSSLGHREAIHYPMIAPEDDRLFGSLIDGAGAAEPPLRITNPLSDRWEIMRRSLVPGLARTIVFNLSRGCENPRLFEVATVHHRGGHGGRTETPAAAIAASGLADGPDWPSSPRPFDLLDLKGGIEALVDSLGETGGPTRARLTFSRIDAAESPFHPGQSFTIAYGGRAIGRGGRLSSEALRAIESDRPLFAAEISIEPFLDAPAATKYQALSRLNPVERDLSFFVPKALRYEAIEQEIRVAISALAAAAPSPGIPAGAAVAAPSFRLVDRFAGGAVPAEKVSYAIRFRFEPRERALTAEELNGAIERIAAHLSSAVGAEIRSA